VVECSIGEGWRNLDEWRQFMREKEEKLQKMRTIIHPSGQPKTHQAIIKEQKS